VTAFKLERERGIETVTTDEAFQALPEVRRAQLVEECGLRAVDMPDASTDTSLLLALDRTPLDYWTNMIGGLESRFARAREIAGKEAFKAVRVTPSPAMLKDRAAADAYVDELRTQIMQHIDAGKPVVI